MFGSDILEVCIGIAFVFALVSTICSSVRESLEALLKTRASYLEFCIRQLLYDVDGNGLAKQFFNHPSIFVLFRGPYVPGPSRGRPSLWRKPSKLPSYIPARSFAVAVMDIVGRGAIPAGGDAEAERAPLSTLQLRLGAAQIENADLRRALLLAIDSAQGSVERVREAIEAWYDSAMERVSGWYKRSTHWILFGIALVIAVGANVNTLTIADHLYRHTAIRSAVVSTAAGTTGAPGGGSEQALEQLEALDLPIGWGQGPHGPARKSDESRESPGAWWNKILSRSIGWLMTAFAATLGAPFWFDLLSKIMVIRSSTKPREKSGQGSEDRTPAPREQPAVQASQSVTLATAAAFEARHDDEDSCGVGNLPVTPDDRLPPARGGVA